MNRVKNKQKPLNYETKQWINDKTFEFDIITIHRF